MRGLSCLGGGFYNQETTLRKTRPQIRPTAPEKAVPQGKPDIVQVEWVSPRLPQSSGRFRVRSGPAISRQDPNRQVRARGSRVSVFVYEGVSENWGYLITIRIPLFGVLYLGSVFSETPMKVTTSSRMHWLGPRGFMASRKSPMCFEFPSAACRKRPQSFLSVVVLVDMAWNMRYQTRTERRPLRV